MTAGPIGLTPPAARSASAVPASGGLLSGRLIAVRVARTIGVQAFIMGLNICTGVLTARLLGPDGRGIFAAVTLWPQMLSMVLVGGLPYAVIYFASGEEEEARRAIGTTLLMGLALGLFGTVLGAALIPLAMAGHYPDSARHFAQASTVVCTVNITVILLRQALLARNRLDEFNTACWMDPALYLFLLVATCLLTPLTAERGALCMYAAGVVVCLWLARRVWTVARPTLAGVSRSWRPIASYTGRAAGTGMLSSLALYFDRVVLVSALPPRDLGLYAVAFSLSRLVSIVQTAIAAVVLPAMAGSSAQNAKALHDTTFRLVLAAMFTGGAGVLVLGRPALVLLYGAGFAEAEPILVILVADAALTCLCQVVVQLFLALGKPGYTSWVQGASFVVTAALLMVLVPSFGAIGAAAAVTAGSVLRLTMLLAGVKARLALPLPAPRGIVQDVRAIARRGRA